MRRDGVKERYFLLECGGGEESGIEIEENRYEN